MIFALQLMKLCVHIEKWRPAFYAKRTRVIVTIIINNNRLAASRIDPGALEGAD